MAMIWDSKVYACGHKEWKYPSALSSRDLYEWATKNTPDLCSWCRVLLLQQRLNYFNNAREKLGDFPARQLLLQVIDAKSYAPANAFLFLLNQWVFGATQRLDGPDDEASSEVARVLAALDGARQAPGGICWYATAETRESTAAAAVEKWRGRCSWGRTEHQGCGQRRTPGEVRAE